MPRRKHYHVYVVELFEEVLLNARFMRSNLDYQPGKQCVYVGMTGLDPDVRFDKHKAAFKPTDTFRTMVSGCCRKSMRFTTR